MSDIDELRRQRLDLQETLLKLERDVATFYSESKAESLPIEADEHVSDLANASVRRRRRPRNFKGKLSTYSIGPYVKAELYKEPDFAGGEAVTLNPRTAGSLSIYPPSFSSIKVISTDNAVQEIQAIRSTLADVEREISSVTSEVAQPETPIVVDVLRTTPVVLPSFLLRSFAALSSLLGPEKQLAAQDVIRAERENKATGTAKQFFDFMIEPESSYPFALSQFSVFDRDDPIRIAFAWLSSLRENPNQSIVSNSQVFSELLRIYCSGPVMLWEISSAYLPSFVYHFEAGLVRKYIVSRTQFARSLLVLPVALPGTGRQALEINLSPLQQDLSGLSYTYERDAKMYLQSKHDVVSVLIEAAHYGVDWDGARLTMERDLHVMRNTAAFHWKITAFGNAQLFEGVYMSHFKDLLSVTTAGSLRGSKLVDVVGGDIPAGESEPEESSKALTTVYAALSNMAESARSGKRYNRDGHANAVSEYRRTVCRWIATHGLICMKKGGGYLWVGHDPKASSLCVRQAVEISDEMKHRMPGDAEGPNIPNDQTFVVRQDKRVSDLSTVSAVVDACGDTGLLVLLCCIEAGSVVIEGRFSSYTPKSAYSKETGTKENAMRPAVVLGDVPIPFKFVFVLFDEIVICANGYGAPKGKTLIKNVEYGMLSDKVSMCRPDKVVQEHFMIEDVLVG